MEFSWFTRAIARVVLVSYVTQVFAPLIHASELDTRPERPWGNGLRDPSPPREKILQHSFQQALDIKPCIETLEDSSSPSRLTSDDFIIDEDQARLQAESYQYRLRVKTKGDHTEQVKLKLSRKEKGSNGPFEHLHKSQVDHGVLTSSTSCEVKHANDVLMNFLKGASVYRVSYLKDTAGLGWMIPGLATIGVTSEGGVVLKQDNALTLLSHYDLVLKTSQSLSLDYLKVASLALDAPTTKIIGSVSVESIHITHQAQTVINQGGLNTAKIMKRMPSSKWGRAPFSLIPPHKMKQERLLLPLSSIRA